MKDYTVVYEIIVKASSPEEAASIARKHIGNDAVALDVYDNAEYDGIPDQMEGYEGSY